MVLLALALILSAPPATQKPGRFDRFCTRTDQGRSNRGLQCSGELFGFAPTTGDGMPAACSTTAPTGTKGETTTTARASNATCSTVGTATTGITNGSQSVVSSNIARIEPDAQGVRGVMVENAATNDSLRSAEICTAPWADVGTPGCLSDQGTGPWGTATMDSITDNDAVAFEGRTQSITTSSATIHAVQCKVKSVSGATSASITMVGTGSATGDCTGTVTGLSTSTSSLVTCTSPAAYGGGLTAVAYTIRVGTVVADQGTILIEDCQHENTAVLGPTSIIPTTSGAVTRALETISVAPTWPSSATISMGANFTGPTPTAGSASTVLEFTAIASLLNESGGTWRWFSGGVGQNVALLSSVGGLRTYGYHDGAVRGMGWGANTAGPTADVNAANKFGATLYIGGNSGARPNGVITRVQVDPNPNLVR